ncbi:MAG: hypothetical protein ACP5OG_05950 [Candidatus Nanoarchaeia archaeon]
MAMIKDKDLRSIMNRVRKSVGNAFEKEFSDPKMTPEASKKLLGYLRVKLQLEDKELALAVGTNKTFLKKINDVGASFTKKHIKNIQKTFPHLYPFAFLEYLATEKVNTFSEKGKRVKENLSQKFSDVKSSVGKKAKPAIKEFTEKGAVLLANLFSCSPKK